MSRLDHPTRGIDKTSLYVGAGAAALLVVGLIAWAGSDDVDTGNQPAQTEIQQPRTGP